VRGKFGLVFLHRLILLKIIVHRTYCAVSLKWRFFINIFVFLIVLL